MAVGMCQQQQVMILRHQGSGCVLPDPGIDYINSKVAIIIKRFL